MEKMDFVPRRSRSSSYSSIPSKHGYHFIDGVRAVLLHGPLNGLLICGALLPPAWYMEADDSVLFILSLLCLAPVAERLGYVTEQIAIHTSDTIGGLLNATFGNMTELIVGLVALRQGYYRLVQLSLLGSILSNLLLVLGSSFLVGGMRYPIQKHGKITSQINSSLLMVAAMGLLFPTILTLSEQETTLGELDLSRGAAVILLFLYFSFLYYQLFVPMNGYDSAPTKQSVSHLEQSDEAYQTEFADARGIKVELEEDEQRVEEEEEEDTLGLWYGIVWLAIITVVISYLSDLLVNSVTDAADSLNISSVFLSAIAIPIIGNAAEHASAINFGYKNRLELSLAIAVGSSTQIALMVLPLLTVIGWVADKPMSFNFSSYESTTLLLTIILVTFALKDGRSNWLLGLILMGAYGLIALGFWAHSDESLE